MQVSPPELHVVPSETMCEDVSVRLDAVVYGLGCCICDIVSLRAQIAFYYKARVNIPALSDRTVCRDVVASGITTGAEIQVNFHIHVLVHSCCSLLVTVLDTVNRAAATFPPNTEWWIKGDAVDLVKGFGESVRDDWSSDIDLNDGQLKQMF